MATRPFPRFPKQRGALNIMFLWASVGFFLVRVVGWMLAVLLIDPWMAKKRQA